MAAALVTAFLVGGAVNGGSDGDTADVSATTTVPAEPSVAAPPTAAIQTPTPAAPSMAVVPPPPAVPATTAATMPPVDFAMPDLTGLDLQTAQNQIQTNGVFLSVSHDLLGSRGQLVDSNWIVCTQNIAPGERVTRDVEGVIDLGVVKREEVCP